MTSYRRNNYRGRSRRGPSPFAEVRAGDVAHITITATGATIHYATIIEVGPAGITASYQAAQSWGNIDPAPAVSLIPWSNMRAREMVTRGPAWAADDTAAADGPETYRARARMSYGYRVAARGRCEDAPCCGCCD